MKKYEFVIVLNPKVPWYSDSPVFVDVTSVVTHMTGDPEEKRVEIWERYVKLGYDWCVVSYTEVS